MSQEYGNAVLETNLKVPIFISFIGHSCCYHDSQLETNSQAHQHHLGVSSLAYQGLSWARLIASLCPRGLLLRTSF